MIRQLPLVAAMFLSTLASTAQAACPWEGELDVSAKMREVRVNDQVYDVRDELHRKELTDVLEACGLQSAAPEFEKWRKARRLTNGGAIATFAASGPVGYVASPLGLVIVIGASIDAGIHKARFVRLLDGVMVNEVDGVVQVTRPDDVRLAAR